MIATLSGLLVDFEMIKTIILARETPISLKEFYIQLLGAEKTIKNRMHFLVQSMVAMYTNVGNPSISSSSYMLGHFFFPVQCLDLLLLRLALCHFLRILVMDLLLLDLQSAPNGFSQSNGVSQRNDFLQNSLFLGYSSYGKIFGPSNTTNFNGQGNRSFGNNNCYKGKGNGGYKPRFNGNINGQFWVGNTFHRLEIIHECQICSRKCHNAVTCLFRSGGGQVVQECQICGKRGHIAIDCRYMGNYAYQRAPHPPSITVHYAFQDLSSQFQHPNSFANVMLSVVLVLKECLHFLYSCILVFNLHLLCSIKLLLQFVLKTFLLIKGILCLLLCKH